MSLNIEEDKRHRLEKREGKVVTPILPYFVILFCLVYCLCLQFHKGLEDNSPSTNYNSISFVVVRVVFLVKRQCYSYSITKRRCLLLIVDGE